MHWTVKTRIHETHQHRLYSRNWPDNACVQTTMRVNIETKRGKHYVPRLPVIFFMLKRPKYIMQRVQELLEYHSQNSVQFQKLSKKSRQYPIVVKRGTEPVVTSAQREHEYHTCEVIIRKWVTK